MSLIVYTWDDRKFYCLEIWGLAPRPNFCKRWIYVGDEILSFVMFKKIYTYINTRDILWIMKRSTCMTSTMLSFWWRPNKAPYQAGMCFPALFPAGYHDQYSWSIIWVCDQGQWSCTFWHPPKRLSECWWSMSRRCGTHRRWMLGVLAIPFKSLVTFVVISGDGSSFEAIFLHLLYTQCFLYKCC